MSTKFKFEVELAREISQEEFEALHDAVLAQCEEVLVNCGETNTIGYVTGTEESEVGNKYTT